MLSGGADALTTYTGFSVVLFAGVAVLALFVLRRREPERRARSRRSGYPVAPGDLRPRQRADRRQRALHRLVVPIRTGRRGVLPPPASIVVGLGVPLYFVFSAAGIASRVKLPFESNLPPMLSVLAALPGSV